MKQLLTLAFGIISTLSALGDISVAQPKAEEQSRPTGAEMRQPATGETREKPRPVSGEITGTVTGVDPSARTFTVMAHGRAISFSAARLRQMPTSGETIDISFTLGPSGLPIATSAAKSVSAGGSSSAKPGGYCHCNSHSFVRPPLKSLNVCKC